MKKILLISLLLTNFGMAEEANYSDQETIKVALKNLQDLGRGYAQDPTNNQIYYEGNLIEVYSPKTFTIINKDSKNSYDAEDYYTYYTAGKADVEREKEYGVIYEIDYEKAKVPLQRGPNTVPFDYALNIPAKCFDDKDVPADLLKCYQKYIPFDIWSDGPPLNPDNFKVLGELGRHGWIFVTDGHRVIALTTGSVRRKYKNFSIENIDDFSTFQFVGRQSDSAILNAREEDSLGYGLKETLFYNQEKEMWENRIPLEEIFQWEDSMALRLFYFKDKKYVYANHLGVIEEADPETFELLTFPYAKDKDHIFYYGKILKDANRDEFEILDYRLKIARDKTKIFYKNHVLTELDVETFKLISSPFPNLTKNDDGTYVSNGRYTISECPIALLMDKKSTYYVDALLSDEPEHFISLKIAIVNPRPNRLYGMVSLPLFLLDYTDINVLKGSNTRCRSDSHIYVTSRGETFRIGRSQFSMNVYEIKEEYYSIRY